MTVPAVTTGRGAWRPIGKDNGSRYYTFVDQKPVDGDQPGRDVNYQAVHLAVKAIQARVNAYGYSPALVVDGEYGASTAAGVLWLQKRIGIGADGVVGPTTAKALWKDLLIWYGGVYHVPASQLYGFVMLESGADPGAVGVTTPSDRGLNQINLVAHSNITVEQAFDPHYAINYTAKRLGDARAQFSGKTVELKNYCAIAQHNSPRDALAWYRDGSPPNDRIKRYVDLVLEQAVKFN
jgi:peptidoglycan hydrolase-like protein with peptidoglycan-binding domain